MDKLKLMLWVWGSYNTSNKANKIIIIRIKEGSWEYIRDPIYWDFVIEAYPTKITEDVQISRVSFSGPTLLAMTVFWVYI
jgi:hypothetical protein